MSEYTPTTATPENWEAISAIDWEATAAMWRERAESAERRVIAAIYDSAVNRFEVELEWPECHAKKCQVRHGDPRQAFAMMKHQIVEAVQSEMRFHATTRPDVAEPDDSPEDAAALALAVLFRRYNVHDAGTWTRAARLIIDAYPALIPALTAIRENGGSDS